VASTSRGRIESVALGVPIPELRDWAVGNTGVRYVWSFASRTPGPRVTLQALTHGNELCGAIVLDWLMREALRPTRGVLNIVFANVAAYDSFDPSDPFASRCIDEDFNRLWSEDLLDGTRRSCELARARELRPFYDATDYLLDLHSMTDAAPALTLAGRHPKGVQLARGVGTPQMIVIDAGHRAGKRLRDYAFFDQPDDPRAALLVECGQHWERSSVHVAKQTTLHFLRHLEMADRGFLEQHIDPAPLPAQTAIEVTDAITIRSDRFAFMLPVSNLGSIPKAGTLLARDGDTEVRTPHDDCLLIMPTRRPRPGETAVRLARVVG